MNNQEVAARLVGQAFPGVGFVAMPSASQFIGISEKQEGTGWPLAGTPPDDKGWGQEDGSSSRPGELVCLSAG